MADDLFGEDFFDDEFLEEIVVDKLTEEKKVPSPVLVETQPLDVPIEQENRIEEPRVTETPKLFEFPPDTGHYVPVETRQGRFYMGERQVTPQDAYAQAEALQNSSRFEQIEQEALEVHRLRASELLTAPHRPLPTEGRIPWVEKYAPRKFVDLLTPAEANRQFMQWLKAWRAKISQQGRGGAQPNKDEDEDGEENPHRPVLILCGPAGCGKSAMVEICAAKSNFAIVDCVSGLEAALSKEAVEKAIENVCTNASVLEIDRPRMLLLEAEGESEALFLEAVVRAKTANKIGFLRPVVIILTASEPDALLWSRHVRPLHPFAHLLKLANPSVLKVQERIREVARLEAVTIESLAVNKLVEICGFDIRAALNQLQALAATKGRSGDGAVTVGDVVSVTTSLEHGNRAGGVKDTERTEEQLLTMLFKPRKSRGDERKHRKSIVDEVLPDVKANGTNNNLGGLLAHGLTAIPFTDPGLRTTRQVTRALALGDRAGDLSVAALAISANCAGVGQLRFDMPAYKRNSKLRYQLDQERKAAFHALTFPRKSRDTRLLVVPGLFLATRSTGHPSWVKDPKAQHAELERLLGVFHSYGLSLAAVAEAKTPETEEFALNPNLDLLACKFPLWQSREAFEKDLVAPFWRANSAYVELFVKKLTALSRQPADLVTKLKHAQPAQQTPCRKRASTPGAAGASQSKKPKTSSGVQAIDMALWCGASKKRLDFGELQNSGQSGNKHNLFEFHFQEGHTNAVKRPVYLKEFTH